MILGVDPSSKKIAMIHLGEEDNWARVIDTKGARGEVLAYLTTESMRFLEEYPHPELKVFIERPLVGRNVKSTIVQAEVSGMFRGLAGYFQFAAYPVHPSTWKKEVVGSGRASKDEVKEWLGINHPDLAGLAEDDQDLVDAACIALYGKQTLRIGRLMEESGEMSGHES